ncbi:MAG: Ppx/GppA family phosphatase [Clostridia bacterium]|nr:Ppx/GppA family phosphatase [Clostridia bacterium]MBR2966038.1 Ppx/GppA family phosphatase [Clostridia bacterium]
MERIALIDLGSNTARLVIYDVLDNGYFLVSEEHREAVRLGETEADGNLKQTRIMQSIATLKMFKEMCAIKNVDKILAVATAAVRRASNQKTFLSDVFNATGIRLTIVSEEEEANYVYQGVINSMEIPRGLIMEIGGGSTKFVYYNRRTILHTHIFEFGAVTLANMFNNADKAPEQISDEMVAYVRQQLEQVEWFKEIDPDTQLIGVGGSCRNLARIIRKVKKYPLDMVHNYHMSVEDFNYVYNMVRPLDLDKKRRIKGLSSARADVFPSALAVIKAFVDYMGFTKIVASGSGLREGVMFNHVVPQTLEKPISDTLGYSMQTFLRHMGANIQHAEQTFNLCVQLFKQLRVLHKFPRQYVRVLRVAAMMHDIGKSFKFYNNAKHTSYMILNSNLYGVSHRDIVLAAYVMDMSNKEETNTGEWAKYNVILSPEDVEAVKKLSIILRLAVALDTSMRNVISEISCDVLGDSVIMKVETNGDSLLEHKAANLVAMDFKKIFRKNLEIL